MGRTALCRGHRGAPAERGDAVSGAGGVGRREARSPGRPVVEDALPALRHSARRPCTGQQNFSFHFLTL